MDILYVIATPIGNLKDITYRAVECLKTADIIACEDTRQTAKLLQKYEISKPLISYHQHSKLTKIDYLIDLLKQGKDIALVSDAGTPGISDPGQILISEAIKNNIKVVPLPGPCAAICALQASGLNFSKFAFYGFPPNKKGRQTFLKNIINEDKPVILYESCHRINKLLKELGQTKVVVAKELTKIYETFYRGIASEINISTPKGEYVVIVL
ncbi:MAG: 16S rRNA (cytidine(1402)-2'-O)-methyltransferase [Patescibacteria group bacterium]